MNLARDLLRVAVTTLLCGYAATARANTTEDLQGVGARTNAMGGAGTALYGDFTAAYYNPAALSRCTDDHIGVDVRHTMYALHTTRRGADAPPNAQRPLNDQTRVTTGLCLRFPYQISMGLSLGVGLQNLASLDQAAPSTTPNWVMYGESLQQFSIAVGFAYKPIEQLSIGFGGSILVNTDLSFAANVPIAQDLNNDGYADPMDVNLRLNIQPTGAPYLGVLVAPIPKLRFGITYRGPMFLNLDVPATIRASAIGIDIPIPIQVQGIGWYTPRQLALGASVDATDDLTFTADLTYYQWSALNDTYYPYLAITPQSGYDNTVVGALSFPRMGRPGWRDIWVPRVGAELRVMDSRLALRGGYGFRPSTLPTPGSTTMLGNDGTSRVTNVATLLDSGVHSISFGAGYYFGDRPHERNAAEPTPPASPSNPPAAAQVLPYDADGFELEPAHPDEAQVFVAMREGMGDYADRGAQTRGRTPPSPSPTPARPSPSGARPATTPVPPARATAPSPVPARPPVPSPATTASAGAASPTAAAPAQPSVADVSAADEPDTDLPGITAHINVYFRANLFQQRVDLVKDIAYGGAVYDLGVQMSLGWY